jgi:triacylglycerol lipase
MQIAGSIASASTNKRVEADRRDRASAPVYEIARTLPSDTWEQTEVIRDRDELFVQRQFHPRSKHRDQEVIEAFQTDAPHSGDALLHYAGAPPEGQVRKTPVLLIHGANKNGNFFWDPSEDGADKGLAQRLREDGHDTFALTFAHNQDDNFLWAEQIANAIAEIKKDTGADKVDIVAHSKGCVAARIYTSDVRKEGVESTPYQEDVRRMVLVGGPNKGVDYVFRHPSANYALLQDSDQALLNAPVSWEKQGVFPFFRDVSDQGYSKDGPNYFPGQSQLLADLSEDFPLGITEPDWATTYHGGTGFVSVSKGIRHYIEEGGHLIQRLNDHPPDSDVEVAVLAGNRANIPGILNEYTGPSDGLVFVSSALTMPENTNLVAQDVLPLHHKALIADESGQDWIAHVLEDTGSNLKPQQKQILSQIDATWNRSASLSEGANLVRKITSQANSGTQKG